jgi:hypothetical protein
MVDPKATSFKEMSWDEKEKFMEKSSHEVLGERRKVSI